MVGTVIASYILGSAAVAGTFAYAAVVFGANLVATYVVNRLFTKKADSGTANDGARVQLPPATDNRLPVSYGTAWLSPIITDAKISTDQKTMWYVCALQEFPDTVGATVTYGDIYWGDKYLTFDATDRTRVIKWNPTGKPGDVGYDATQDDTRVNGFLNIYLYGNGSSAPLNTTSSAITVLQDTQIGSSFRWTSTDTMSSCSFAIVKVQYNQQIGLTGLDQLRFQTINSITKPGDVLLDYLTNSRYGCAVPLAQINTTSLTALNTYSDQLITYTPSGGGSATQARYRINGPLNTGDNCFSNLQTIADCCDSWLQWNEALGQWAAVINQAYSGTLSSLFNVSDDIVVGAIQFTPVDLNSTYNTVEVSYPDSTIKDQTNQTYLSLTSLGYTGLLNPNEPVNKLSMNLPLVNNSIGAQYIAARRLFQSREDLNVSLTTQYSGIQIDAGDVVRLNIAKFQWVDKLFRVTQVVEGKDSSGQLYAQLFMTEYNATVYSDRLYQQFIPVSNTGITNPNLATTPVAPTFNNITAVAPVPSFVVRVYLPQTGIYSSAEIWASLGTDTLANYQLVKQLFPANGPIFDTTNTNAPDASSPYPTLRWVSYTVTGATTGTYYARARMITSTGSESQLSTASSSISWAPNPTGTIVGQNFSTEYQPNPITVNVFANGSPDLANVNIKLYGISGPAQVDYTAANSNANMANNTWRIDLGNIVANNITIGNPTDGGTYAQWPAPTAIVGNVATITSPIIYKNDVGNTFSSPPAIVSISRLLPGQDGSRGVTNQAYISVAYDPTTANTATLTASFNTFTGYTTPITNDTAVFYNATTGTISSRKYASNAWSTVTLNVPGQILTTNSVSGTNILSNTVTGNNIQTSTITGNNIVLSTITGNLIAANTITSGLIAANAIITGLIAANAVTATQISANTITGNKIAGNTITGDKITGSTITGNLIAANTITGNLIAGTTITGDKISANTITGNLLVIATITGDKIAANTITGNTITGNTITGDKIAANTITGNSITAATITGDKIAGNTITGDNIAANTISANNIQANAISTASLAANSVTTDKLVANAVTSAKIAANAIYTDALQSLSVTTDKLAANSVNADKIVANSITANKIAANSITSINIAANAITTDKLDANSITSDKIAANSITTVKLLASSVTSDKIAANAITSVQIAAGSITTDKLAANFAITGDLQSNNRLTVTNVTNGNPGIVTFSGDANQLQPGTQTQFSSVSGMIQLNGQTYYARPNTLSTFDLYVDANLTVPLNTTAYGVYNGGGVINFRVGDFKAPGYWLQTSSGNARFGGNVSIGSNLNVANLITAGQLNANVVSSNNLIVGAVSQSRSTQSTPSTSPIPFYNWPTTPKTWPDQTRAIVPPNGVTIVPTTDPTSSANTEYTEGSRIQVGYSVRIYSAANTASNLIEIWKSGATNYYSRGFNTLRHATDTTGSQTSTVNTSVALGYGGLLYSSNDGGATWTATGSSTTATLTGQRIAASASSFNLQAIGTYQQVGTNFYNRTGGVTGAAALTLNSTVTIGGQSYAGASYYALEKLPATGTRRGYYPSGSAGASWMAVGNQGLIIDYATTSTQYGAGVTLNDLYALYGCEPSGANFVTIIVGANGTLIRNPRTLTNPGSTFQSQLLTLRNGNPITTDLYGVASDSTASATNTRWVVVGQYGVLMYSSNNGVTWTQVLTPTADNLRSVRFCNGTWVAVGDNGLILTATNPAADTGTAGGWTRIQGSLTTTSFYAIDYHEIYDRISIAGQGGIWNTARSTINFTSVVANGPDENLNLTRLAFYGSNPVVSNTSPVTADQQILNGQVYSGTIIDTNYSPGQRTTYYLVVGNQSGSTIYAGQAFLNATEYKR